MKRIWRNILSLFKGEEMHSYWTVACQARYTDVGITLESYVSSHLFETWQDAARFACRLEEKFAVSQKILGVVEVKTTLPLTVTKVHYDVTDEFGNHQVSYYWPEGVDQEAQVKAEAQAVERRTHVEKLLDKIHQEAQNDAGEAEAKQAQRRRPGRPRKNRNA